MCDRGTEWAANQMKQVAYVMSQTVAAQARIQGMMAENQRSEANGEAQVHNESAFIGVIEEHGLYHNSVLETLQVNF